MGTGAVVSTGYLKPGKKLLKLRCHGIGVFELRHVTAILSRHHESGCEDDNSEEWPFDGLDDGEDRRYARNARRRYGKIEVGFATLRPSLLERPAAKGAVGLHSDRIDRWNVAPLYRDRAKPIE